jgi:hypothetical protein
MPTKLPQRAAEAEPMNALSEIETEAALALGAPVGVTVQSWKHVGVGVGRAWRAAQVAGLASQK